MTADIKIYFVLSTQYEDETFTSIEMQQAFEVCRQNQITPEWIKEENCLTMEFRKKDIIVFEKFEGEIYQQVQTRLVVGPWCIITCLLEGIQVPNNKSPVYNMAMNGLVVSASNYPTAQKNEIKTKVEMMGGIFSFHITNSVTHLVTNSVRTEKYAVANTRGLAVMLETWIDAVWTTNLTRRIKATDAEFFSHKCSAFQNLRVCSTGFELAERQELQQLITEHGGCYSGRLVTASTDILICKPGTKSEKMEVARRAKLPCVRMEWVHDSITKGYALPEADYIIRIASSTPTKNDAPLNVDFSMMSAISGQEASDFCRTSASDTLNMFSLMNEHSEPLARLQWQQVQTAGAFLDGCGVLLHGWTGAAREQLCRVLRNAGATRYDHVNDRVTHILMADGISLNDINSGIVPVVSLEWLLESIKLGRPADEEPYLIKARAASNLVTPASPLSKRGLTLLQHDTSVHMEAEPIEPVNVQLTDTNDTDNHTLRIYRSQQDTLAQLLAQGDIDTHQQETTTDITMRCTVFEGKTFRFVDMVSAEAQRLLSEIQELGGRVLIDGPADYVVVPGISYPIDIKSKVGAHEIVVNSLWILECRELDELILEISYYHRPLQIKPTARPLSECVIAVSGYTGIERSFLVQIITQLGAVYQDKFARITVADGSVRASTHLVCREPQGPKWAAAQRWHRPTVTHLWLLRCAETGTRLPEETFSLTNIDDNDENIPELSKNNNNNSFTKETNQKPQPDKTVDSEQNVQPQIPVDNSKLQSGAQITLEDGSVVYLNQFMADLRAIGVFDTPSPLRLPVGTPPEVFLERMRRKGKLNKSHSTPTNMKSPDVTGNKATTITASQDTPVGRYLRGLQERNVLPSSPKLQHSATDSPLPRLLTDVQTPEAPLGRFMGDENPSRSTRKYWQRFMNSIPHYSCHDRPPARPRRPSTPMNEFVEHAWQYFLREDKDVSFNTFYAAAKSTDTSPTSSTSAHISTCTITSATISTPISTPARGSAAVPTSINQNDETDLQREISDQIGQLQEAMKQHESLGPRRSLQLTFNGHNAGVISTTNETTGRDTQPDTIGWDEPLEAVVSASTSKDEPTTECDEDREEGDRIFMLSGFDATKRVECCNAIRSLGGKVSELNTFDCTATYVVCTTPARNEKILSSMAAGKWLLHASYIEKSLAAGHFLPAALFELGNPRAESQLDGLIQSNAVIASMHWWRLQVLRTGRGAFHSTRALVFAKNLQPIVRLIEAGGGVVIDMQPPFEHRIDITHCFIDPKIKINLNDFIPLAQQGIPCLNVLYLSNFLTMKSDINETDFILQELRNHYN